MRNEASIDGRIWNGNCLNILIFYLNFRYLKYSFHFNFSFHCYPLQINVILIPMYVLQAKVQSPSSSTNPFLSSPTNNANQPIVDLFGAAENQVCLYFFFYKRCDLVRGRIVNSCYCNSNHPRRRRTICCSWRAIRSRTCLGRNRPQQLHNPPLKCRTTCGWPTVLVSTST